MGKKLKLPSAKQIGFANLAGVAPWMAKPFSKEVGRTYGVGPDAGNIKATPFTPESQYSDIEIRSGIAAPKFESMRDHTTGQLKDIYKYDPTKSEAFGQLRTQAMSTGPSAWAGLQSQRQLLEEQNLRDLAAKQGLQAQSQAQSMLARGGGLSSGASQRLALQSSRDQMLRGQEIGRQGMLDRLGISSQDEDTRQQLLRGVAEAETGAQKSNLGTLTGDIGQQREFDINKYRDQMAAWGAQNTAAAQQAAARGKRGKK